ncbi:MAG: Smr/MutS family protein [Candidatus Krumholzibacteriota bacterium]|nr:Smr/MutS family protein [Candidatus Krumholzibacteriota bacterium]
MRPDEPGPVEYPINGTLDLHMFQPREVKELVPDFLRECMKRKIYRTRIIHGKGTGALRETVHAILDRMEEVASYRLCDEGGGGWGATLVILHPQP